MPVTTPRARVAPVVFCLLLTSITAADDAEKVRRPIRSADYGRWEALDYRRALSDDGRWLAYGVRRVDGEHELRLRMLATDSTDVIEHGTGPVFSHDDNWLAYAIRAPRKASSAGSAKPSRNKLGLRSLVDGKTTVIEDVASFSFAESGQYLAMRRYPVEGKKSRGVDLVVRDLATAVDTTCGNVSQYAWSEDGQLLAMVIDAEGRAGNGVRVWNPATGVLRTLDSAAAGYGTLTWREKSHDLAVLREIDLGSEGGKDSAKTAGKATGAKKDPDPARMSRLVVCWRDAGRKSRRHEYDHREDDAFPATHRIVDWAGLRFSDDGETLFFGIRELEEPVEPPEKKEPEIRRFETATFDDGDDDGDDDGADKPAKRRSLRDTLKEPSGVEIWHADDVDIQPRQKKIASQEKRRSTLSAWWIDDDEFVRLGDDLAEDVALAGGQKRAICFDRAPWERDRMFGPTLRDVYSIDVRTGKRDKILERLKFGYDTSPDGRWFLYNQNGVWSTCDLQTGRHFRLTAGIEAPFVNEKDGTLTDEPAPYGVLAWTASGDEVLLYSRYDVWRFAADGSRHERITRGAEDHVAWRRVVLDREKDEFVTTDRPVWLRLYGERSKRFGYARWQPGEKPREQIFRESDISGLMKSRDSETYAFVEQDFDDSPDIFVGGPDLDDARQVTNTNPFQTEYLWGHSELVDYRNRDGRELQGALFYPAGWQPEKKYPMIVYIYEKRSQVVHRYSTPTETHPYNPAVFTSQGYFVFEPDIVYRPQNPGLSAVDCVVPAVEMMIETGKIDRERVGLVGHSWGAYQTAFIVTQTDLFAAGVAGAPLTDMISMSLSIYWNSGQTDAWIFHESQGRMDRPFWRDIDTYVRNSPVFSIDRLDTPLLVAFGDDDGAVDWHQGIQMYNAARLAGKDLVLLVYPGENHGLARKPNQVDYHHRVLEWFGHYLKGDKPRDWITRGKPYLERQRELEARKKKARPGR